MSNDKVPALIEDPALSQAYQKVRANNGGASYAILNYVSKEKLGVQAVGNGSIEEGAANFKDDQSQYGFFKVSFRADDDTERTKFVLVTWLGPNVSILQKAKLSVHKPLVKSVFRDCAVEITSSDRSELTSEALTSQIKRVNY
eukprot:TRINITY_DN11248_c0_g1_i1.p1 TRINITY_DN11248_c0_g1~~TRINITY_DN11248_c0_g1_i1.p1  ORF type:complete len:143 (+),score=28.35 TRINITY_DN11248_c0_g1_i1:48-476(+)